MLGRKKKPADTLYVVVGKSGSHLHEIVMWPVIAYTNRKAAERYRAEAQRQATKRYKALSNYNRKDLFKEGVYYTTRDSHCYMKKGGVEYFVREIKIKEEYLTRSEEWEEIMGRGKK